MTEQMFPLGAPCWIDLLTSDVDRSNDFYGEVLGWTAGEGSAEFGGYYMYFRDGVPVAGGMPNSPQMQVPDRWGIFLNVADAAATSAAVEAAGGKALSEVMSVGSMGSNVMFTDPSGSDFGVWQAKDFAGCGAVAAVGAACWFELGTSAYEAALDFYAGVFGLDARTTMGDDARFRYATIGAGDVPLAGIMEVSARDGASSGGSRPSPREGWHVYFGVADTDAALERVLALGGSVTREPEESPFGRTAGVADPSGVDFSIVSVDGEGCSA